MNKSTKSNGNSTASKLIIFLVWPFGAWLLCLKSANTKSSFIIFFLFSLLLCWHMSPMDSPDFYDDFIGILERFTSTHFTTSEIQQQISDYISISDEAPKELYENTLNWFTRLFSDNYHFFFLFASIPVALCQLKSMKFITSDYRYDNSWLAILTIIMFIVPRDIITVQNPRFATGFWLCVVCTLCYFCNKKHNWRYLLLILLSPMCHSAMWLYLGLFFAAILISYMGSKPIRALELLAMISIPFTFFDADFLSNFNINILPEGLQRWASIYMSDEYYSHYILNEGKAGFWWVGSFFEFIMRFSYLYMTWCMIRDKSNTKMKYTFSKLYSFYLILFSIVNFVQFVPVLGSRYYWFIRVFCILLWFKFFWGAPKFRIALYLLAIGCFFEMFRRYGYVLGGALSVNTPLDIWFTPLPYLIGKGLLW